MKMMITRPLLLLLTVQAVLASGAGAQEAPWPRLERLPPVYVATASEPPGGASDEEDDRREGAASEAKPLGEAPPDASQVFLRQSAVLLKPGTVELEWGLGYTLQETEFLTILSDGSLVREVTDARALLASWSVRYGLSERWQPYVTVPGGIGLFERANQARQDSETDVGLGDTVVGANYLLRDGEDECADIVLGMSVTCPTGESVYNNLSPNVTPLGAGFWATSVNLNFIQTYDPLVLFASIGHTHQFGREFYGVDIQPGEELNYGVGLGFAVNDDLTLSSRYQSLFQWDSEIDGVRVPDSNTEVSVLRHSVIIRRCQQSFVEVFVAHGVTDDAPSTSIGVLSTRRF